MTRNTSRRPSFHPTHGMMQHDRILVVGTCALTLGLARASGADLIESATLGNLFSAYWSHGAPPDIVMSPLLCPAFDIIDIADRLARLGFAGRLQAVTRPLPDARAVRREVSAECQGFTFELIEIAVDPEVADPAVSGPEPGP